MESTNITFELNRSLRHALGFNQKALIANQDGYMTNEQRETIQRTAYRQQIYLGILVGIIAILILGILLLEIRAHGRLFVLPPVLAFMLAIIGLGAVVALFLWSRRCEFHDDLHKGVVKTAVGQVELIIIPRNFFRAEYKVHVEQHKFSVSKQVLLAFKDAARYRVYYAPFSMTLLSAELIPNL